MGRKPVVPEGDDFLPGVTLGDLELLMKKEADPKNLKKYLVAYNRKAGKTINEIAEVTAETRETVRRWVSAMDKRGLEGIPRRIAKGAARLLTRRQRVALVKAAHKSPRKSGYNADVWTYKDLWLYAKKKFGTTISYSAAVRCFHEMGIVLKTPRPKHPNAAGEEERAAYRRAHSAEKIAVAPDAVCRA